MKLTTVSLSTAALVSLLACSNTGGVTPAATNSAAPNPALSGTAGAISFPPNRPNKAGPPEFAPGAGVGGGVGFGVGVGVAPSRTAAGTGPGAAPIQGGTLLLTRDGKAFVSDPDRDRVVIADLEGVQVLATLPLQAGDEPGRAVEDEMGQVHVLLRRAGQVAAIDLAQMRVGRRTDVCSMPQGIAFEPSTKLLHVACADGQLVSLPAQGAEVTRRVRVDTDLRDVLISNGKLLVTRFKAAEVLELDAEGAVISRRRPALMQGPFVSPSFGQLTTQAKSFEAAVAWRTVLAPDGRLAMVHQRGQIDPIALHGEGENAQVTGTAGGIGVPIAGQGGGGSGSFDGALPQMEPVSFPGNGSSGSAYGSGIGCEGIVESGVTYLDGSGEVSGPLVPGMVLPVDAAISPDGQWLAIATPGAFQSRIGNNAFGVIIMPMGLVPRPDTATFDGQIMSDPAMLATSTEPFGGGKCLLPNQDAPGQLLNVGQAVAVAFDARGRLVIQTRDPNQLVVAQVSPTTCLDCETFDAQIDLGGVARRDLGHDLFHVNAGGGLACASCHPGGGDDGRTWQFAGIGARRTQLFNMGVKDTLPLHWDGEFSNMNELLLDVFVKRMGGQNLGLEEAEGLQDYIETLHPNTPMRLASDEAAVRGKALFESQQVGCTECHSGQKLTNNKTVDVGTGGLFQVPSLIGVAYHQPYMHNGCAITLRDRFSPSCGGTKHGKTEDLAASEIDDLVAYLESL